MLPPDLARLGDELVAAAHHATERRRRIRRFAVAASGGALAFAALTPAELDPARVTFAETGASYEAPGCRHPRGARFTMPACEASTTLDRPAAWPSYS